MRIRDVVCLGLAFCVSLPLSALCADPDWILIDENKESSFSYDRNSITRIREGVVQVRTRVVYSEFGKQEALKVLRQLPQPEKLYESRYTHEIDCTEREGRPVAAIHFDSKEGILRSTDLEPVTVPEYLPPGSRLAIVADQACTR